MPSVNVIVVNGEGSIPLIRRTDNGNWAVPGGAVDLGESVAQAAVRETLEETGIECEVTGIARPFRRAPRCSRPAPRRQRSPLIS